MHNKISIPIGLILLLLTSWSSTSLGKTSKKVLYRNFKVPFFILLVSFILCSSINLRGSSLISFPLAAFSLSAIIKEFHRATKSRIKRFNESFIKALIKVVSKNRSRFGGHIVHLGIIFMFIGFTGHAFDSETVSEKREIPILMDITLNWLYFPQNSNHLPDCLSCH